MSSAQQGPLQGWLWKRGAKGLTRGWKRRWFERVGDELHYFVNSVDPGTFKGRIILRNIVSVGPSTDRKRKDGRHGFDVITPQRIYELLAENEQMASSWASALSSIRFSQKLGKRVKRLEELEAENERLQNALKLVCQLGGLSISSILSIADNPLLLESSASANPSSTHSLFFQPFQAVVLFDFHATRPEQLSIVTGALITVERKHDKGWWMGTDVEGRKGFFPGSYVSNSQDKCSYDIP